MPGKFQLHKVERDSEGKERYIKTQEDDAIFKAKLAQLQADAANELKGLSAEEKWNWVLAQKEEGNKQYTGKDYSSAEWTYLKALLGVDMGKDLSKERINEINQKLKLPILNNLAQCLKQQKQYPRAMQMIEEALKVDSNNQKALCRKATLLIEMTEFDRAEAVLKKLDDIQREGND